MRKILFLSLLTTSAVFADPTENWGQWRGPLATGVSPTADPPVSWDAKTNIKWKVELPGKSSATPIVWGDRVFVITAVETDRVAQGRGHRRPSIPSSIARPKRRRTITSSSCYCFDRNTGKQLWTHKAAEKVPHEGHHETHSYAAGSPTTDGKRLYVSFGSFGIYCYDLDGKPLWSRDLGRLHQPARLGRGGHARHSWRLAAAQLGPGSRTRS